MIRNIFILMILIFVISVSFAEETYELVRKDDLIFNVDGLIKEYGNVKTLKIESYSQVIQNSFNYRGKDDLSGEFGLVLCGKNLIFFGEIQDNIPLYQTREKPVNPKWWKITYGADGVCLLLSKSEKEEDINRIFFNFGSQGLNPVILLDSIPGKKSGTSSGELAVEKTKNGYSFEAQIPIEELADGLFDKDCFLEILLFDMDGGEETYKVMALNSKVEADLEKPLKWFKAIIKK